MLLFDILGMACVSILWWLGGGKASWARDIIVTIVIGIFVFLHHPTVVLWKDIIIGIATIGACNIIRLGYGAYDPVNDSKPSLLGKITKDKDGWWARCFYGAICGIVTFIPQLALDFNWITFLKAVGFTIQFAAVCFTVVRLRLAVFPTDTLIGLSFAVRIFL